MHKVRKAILTVPSWENMQEYFSLLENDHIVPPGTPGRGFSGPLDITVNGPQYLLNQSNAFKVLQATANRFGQDGTKLWRILTYSDLSNASPNHDQQVGLFGCPAHRTPNGRRVSARTLVVDVWNGTYADGSKKYPNFTVSLHLFATKILFNTTGAIQRYVSLTSDSNLQDQILALFSPELASIILSSAQSPQYFLLLFP
jgi:choline dehydrogenase